MTHLDAQRTAFIHTLTKLYQVAVDTGWEPADIAVIRQTLKRPYEPPPVTAEEIRERLEAVICPSLGRDCSSRAAV